MLHPILHSKSFDGFIFDIETKLKMKVCYVETNQMICIVNQLTGIDTGMIETGMTETLIISGLTVI